MAWAHPKYENVLASCGYDRYVKVWKEVNGQWLNVTSITLASPPNCIAWAPWEYGLVLAVGTTEGKLHMIENHKEGWSEPVLIGSHAESINGVSWGPSTEPALIGGDSEFVLPPRRLVSCSSDGTIMHWKVCKNNEAESLEIGRHFD